MKSSLSVLLLVSVVFISGCNHLPRGSAPSSDLIFDRFDQMQLSFDTSTDIIPRIQNKEIGEFISKNENSVASWGEDGNGAAIWMNAAIFGEDSNRLARKYAFMIDEDDPGYKLYGKSNRMRVDFEYTLPGDFDDITYTSDTERKREIVLTGINMFINDIDQIRLDSDYVYSGAMMVKQSFMLLMYEIEKNPSKMSLLEIKQGLDFDYPTLGPAKAMVVVNQENRVRIKIKVGTFVKDFEKHADVIAMEYFANPELERQMLAEKKPFAKSFKHSGFFTNITQLNLGLPSFGKKAAKPAETVQQPTTETVEPATEEPIAEEPQATEAPAEE